MFYSSHYEPTLNWRQEILRFFMEVVKLVHLEIFVLDCEILDYSFGIFRLGCPPFLFLLWLKRGRKCEFLDCEILDYSFGIFRLGCPMFLFLLWLKRGRKCGIYSRPCFVLFCPSSSGRDLW